LAVSQEGGATIAECLLAASRIDVNDSASWRGEWHRLADANRGRAEQALVAGHLATAQNSWLRSANYYHAASLAARPGVGAQPDLDPDDSAAELALARFCIENYLAGHPRGEVVAIPWLEGRSLDGYLLFPSTHAGPAPAVICVGASGRRKNELFFAMTRHARDRGLALLCVDIGDADEAPRRRARPETSIVAVVDYLTERGDIDGERIAVIGDGSASSWVTRGVALDRRLAAAVCDGGIEELWQSEFATGQGGLQAMAQPIPPAWKTNCPLLVVMEENGWLDPHYARSLLSQHESARSNLSVKIFESAEIGSLHTSADNPTLANEYIFDWIQNQMAAGNSARTAAVRTRPRP